MRLYLFNVLKLINYDLQDFQCLNEKANLINFDLYELSEIQQIICDNIFSLLEAKKHYSRFKLSLLCENYQTAI